MGFTGLKQNIPATQHLTKQPLSSEVPLQSVFSTVGGTAFINTGTGDESLQLFLTISCFCAFRLIWSRHDAQMASSAKDMSTNLNSHFTAKQTKSPAGVHVLPWHCKNWDHNLWDEYRLICSFMLQLLPGWSRRKMSLAWRTMTRHVFPTFPTLPKHSMRPSR